MKVSSTDAINPIDSLRIDWIDAAKGIGIVLMIYGHFLQRGIDPSNTSAVDQLRLIYSFHMPLFFLLSGFFYKNVKHIWHRILQLATRRLLPVLFFSLLLLPIWAVEEIKSNAPFRHDIAAMGIEYLNGRPDFDWVTWFLVCLFVCEVMALQLIARLSSVTAQLIAGFGCVLLGATFANHSSTHKIEWLYFISSTWFFSEAIAALGFYTIGHALYPRLNQLADHRYLALCIGVICAAYVFLTFRSNHPASIAVMMAARQNGNAIKFALTALAGGIAVIAFGTLLSKSRLLCAIGRNTLPLLGLNGLFFHYINPKLAHWIHAPDSFIWVTSETGVFTLITLLICVPLAQLLNHYVPQFIGKSAIAGPWLPRMELKPSN